MGAGGAIGLGGGFAQGLAQVLLHNRTRKDDEKRAAEDKQFRADLATLPIYMQQAQETNDWSIVENVLGRMNPDLAKKFQKEGSPFALLGPLLAAGGQAPTQGAQQQNATAISAASQDAFGSGGEPPIPGKVIASPNTPEPPRDPKSMLFGQPMPTLEEKAKRGVEVDRARMEAEFEMRRDIARKAGMSPQQSIEYATQWRTTPTGAAAMPRYAGTIKGNQIPQGTSDQLGQPIDPDGFYRTQVQPSGELTYIPTIAPSTTDLGDYVENAARSMGFANAQEAASKGQLDAVNKKADELRQSAGGAAVTGRGEAAAKVPLTTSQRFQAITDLQETWRKAEAPRKEMDRQLGLMEVGLKRFQEGDKNGGSQAVLITFQRILDPESVVRESEYARTSQGLGLIQRIEGFRDRLRDGGAGVPEQELAAMVETARQFMASMATYNELEKERITNTAKDYGLDPSRVFGVAAAADQQAAPKPGTPQPAAAPASGGIVMKDGKLYQNGKLLPGQ